VKDTKAGEDSRRVEPSAAKAGGDSRNPQPSGKAGEGRRLDPGTRIGEGSRNPEPTGKVGEGRSPKTQPVTKVGESAPDTKLGDGVRGSQLIGSKGGDGSGSRQPGGTQIGEAARNGDAIRKPDTPVVKSADAAGAADAAGGKSVGERRPISPTGNAGDPMNAAATGIKGDAKDHGAGKPAEIKSAFTPPGGTGQIPPFAQGGADQKTSPFGTKVGTKVGINDGIKDGIKDGVKDGIAKSTPAGDKSIKSDPTKIEVRKPEAPQSRIPLGLTERGLPSIAKPQPEKTRGIASGSRGDGPRPEKADGLAIKLPWRGPGSKPYSDASDLTKPLKLKLDIINRPIAQDVNTTKFEGSAKRAVILAVSKIFASGVLEFAVSRDTVDRVRQTPSLKLEAPIENAPVEGFKIRTDRAAAELSPAQATDLQPRTFGKQVEGKVAMPGATPDLNATKPFEAEARAVAKQQTENKASKVSPQFNEAKADLNATKPADAETRTFAKHKPDGTTSKRPVADAARPGLIEGTARGGSSRVESLLPKSRNERIDSNEVPSDTVPRSIRDVFLKFQLALPKRSFNPEITESGNYVAQRGQSAQRLQAFVSSGQHKVISDNGFCRLASDRFAA